MWFKHEENCHNQKLTSSIMLVELFRIALGKNSWLHNIKLEIETTIEKEEWWKVSVY